MDHLSRTIGSSKHPIVWLFCAFAVGGVIERYSEIAWWVWPAVCLLSALAAYILRDRIEAGILLVTAFIAAGGLCLSVQNATLSDDRVRKIYDSGQIDSGKSVGIKGFIAGVPEPSFGGRFIEVNAEELNDAGEVRDVSGRIRIFVAAASPEAEADLDRMSLRKGTLLSVICDLEREERYLTPGVFSRKQMLDRQGIDASCSVKSPLLLNVVPQESFRGPLETVSDIRLWLIDEIRRLFSANTAGILIASSLGGKHFLDKSTADVFRAGGTFHVLVISGLHITFIGGLLLLAVSRFTDSRKWQFAVTIPLMWAFSLAVGGEPPVIRACVMFTVILFGYSMFRTASPLNALAFTALLIVAWEPTTLFDPSFQLTSASVFAIVALALPLIERLRSIGNWVPTTEHPFPPNVNDGLKTFCETLYWRDSAWDIDRKRNIWSARIFKRPFAGKFLVEGIRDIAAYIFEVLIVSVSVQIILLPLLVYYFHRIPLASLVLNIWVGSLLAIESFMAVAAIITALISDVAAIPFIELTETVNRLMIWTSSAISTGPLENLRVPIYPGIGRVFYFIYFIPVLFLAAILARWNVFALANNKIAGLEMKKTGYVTLALIALLATILVFHPYSGPKADGNLTVEFLDVGQGDAVFITFPDGRTMLVDGGGRVNFTRVGEEGSAAFVPDMSTIGEAVVSEFLWERGYSTVDMLVVSHADADHEQGIVDIARNFDVSMIYLGTAHGEGDHTRELVSVARKKDIPIMTLASNEWFDVAGVGVEVIYPPFGVAADGFSRNDRSLVLRLTYGSRSFLLTGDVEKNGEDAMVSDNKLLVADVVKVPHHGSRTSSTKPFVEAVRAKYAVISVGKRSMFGHPHPEVVERWKDAGATVLITGKDGTTRFVTDGNTLETEHLRPEF